MKTRHLLIIALDSSAPDDVPDADVLVVAPALNAWLRRWMSDEDEARRRAEERGAAFVQDLERRGIHADSRVGDADPVQAIADALAMFPADEIMIAGAPERPTRFAAEVASRASRRFPLPIFRAGGPLPLAA